MKVKILIYLYYPSLWEEYKELLLKIKDYIDIDLLLCNDDIENNNEYIEKDCLNTFNGNSIVRYVDNRGVDIGPFLLQMKDLDPKKHKYFIKLHSKKSLWGRYRNVNWREFLVNALIGNENIFQNNISKMDNNNKIGMIGSRALILNNDKEFYNKNIIEHLMTHILNLSDYNNDNCKFIGGTMFMAKSKLFKKYFPNNICDTLYNTLNFGMISDIKEGTIPHSLERIFGYIVSLDNQIIEVSDSEDFILIENKNLKEIFKIIITYNNNCFIFDKPLICGKLINNLNKDNNIFINWLHLSKNGSIKKYIKNSDNLYNQKGMTAIIKTN